MTPFVIHCGDCGHPLRVGDHTDCARQPVYVYDHYPHWEPLPPFDGSIERVSSPTDAADERAALIADITAVILSMANVPPPVTTPGVGGPLVPPGPTPFAPQPPGASALPTANRFVLRYGVYVCSVCGFAKEFCRGHSAPAPPAQDGAESSLEARIRDAKGRP